MNKPYEGMTALGYCRVSTDDKGQTNETQERAIREWAERTGAELKGIYYDEMTGTTLSRPGLMSAVGRILCDEIQILVAYDHSRLTRNEELDKIREMIGRCSIRFVASDIDPDSLGGRVYDEVKQIFDKEENLQRSIKTAGGMDTRRRNNIHVGRPAKLVFAEELETGIQGLNTTIDGEHKTQTLVYPLSVVMGFADQGLSLNYVANRLLNVNVMALRRALSRKRLVDRVGYNPLEQYHERYINSRRF